MVGCILREKRYTIKKCFFYVWKFSWKFFYKMSKKLCWIQEQLFLHKEEYPPQWKGDYLTKRFQPVHQQEEFVGAMLLRSNRINGSSSILFQGQDSKLRFVVSVVFPCVDCVVSVWCRRYIGLQCTAEQGWCLILINEGLII